MLKNVKTNEVVYCARSISTVTACSPRNDDADVLAYAGSLPKTLL